MIQRIRTPAVRRAVHGLTLAAAFCLTCAVAAKGMAAEATPLRGPSTPSDPTVRPAADPVQGQPGPQPGINFGPASGQPGQPGQPVLPGQPRPPVQRPAPTPPAVSMNPPTTPQMAGALPVPVGGRRLSDAETDQAIEAIFQSARRITHFEAQLKTETYDSEQPDSPARNLKESFGFLRLSTPNLMWMQDYGEEKNGKPRTRAPRGADESSYMIVDGKMFYDIQASGGRNQPAQGKRERLAQYVSDGQAANIAAVLGMYLGLEREVTSAAELRGDFAVEGVAGTVEWERGVTYNHFRLIPLRGADYAVEIWHRPGTALPTRVKMVEKKRVFRPGQRGEEQFIFRHTERAMDKVRSNLDGLRPFGRDAFAVPRMNIKWDDEGR